MSSPCLSLLSLGALLALTGCRTGSAPPARPDPDTPARALPEAEKPLYEGTAVMRARVQKELAHFESADLKERLDAAARLGQMGEPATIGMLDTLERSPSAQARGMAAYTLGFGRDHRALDPLARALRDADQGVRSEAATALARNGDDRGLYVLVEDLEDPDPRVRSRAILVLRDVMGESLGFQPDDDPLDRQAAVARWKGWLERRREPTR